MINVCHLFLSAGHNFFGHHGRPPGDNAVLEVDQIDCVAGRGIRGDRFFDYKADYKGQITFFSLEVFESLRRALNVKAPPSATRRNVFLRGANLRDLIGAEFTLQGLRFLGVEECAPCYWMDLALGPGAEHHLKGRGGLRARILTGGILRRDLVPLDVREDLRAGTQPLGRIMDAAASLLPGQQLLLIAPFRPAPLLRLLESRGFLWEARPAGGEDWEVVFTRADPPAGERTTPGQSAGAPAGRGDPVINLDVRGLEPPQPLVKILEALTALPGGAALQARTDRWPMHLYSHLDERGFTSTTDQQADGSFLTHIRRR